MTDYLPNKSLEEIAANKEIKEVVRKMGEIMDSKPPSSKNWLMQACRENQRRARAKGKVLGELYQNPAAYDIR